MKAYAMVAALALASCKVEDPLYCDDTRPCMDLQRPYCDLHGTYPASAGVARTCIADPFAGDADGGPKVPDGGARETDASADGDGGSACSWTQLVKLAGVNSPEAYDYVGSLDDAGTTLYFSREGSADVDEGLFTATRAPGQAFGDPTPLDGLSDDETFRRDPEISSTGLELIFRVSGGLAAATRASPALPFEQTEEIGIDGHSPSLSGDGRSLYYINGGDVFRAVRAEVGQPWQEGVRVLATTGFGGVDVSPDELRLLLVANALASPPPSSPMLIAERTSAEAPFGAPTPLEGSVLVEGGMFYSNASWNGAGNEMVVSLYLVDQVDMFYAVCQ